MRTTIQTAAILACSLALAAPFAAQARVRQDERAWVNLTAMGSASGRLMYFAEGQSRARDGLTEHDETILRGALGWKLSPSVTVYQGYAHIFVGVTGGRDANEERSFQQLSWNIGKPWGGELSSRTRLEQRWRSTGNDMGLRLRQMLRYEKPLAAPTGPRALVSSELFVAFDDTDWGAHAGFDQVRNFLGLELPLGGQSTAEVGYVNQFVDRGPGDQRMNHVASIGLFYRP